MAHRSAAVTLARDAVVACFFGVIAPFVVLAIFLARTVRNWGKSRATQARGAYTKERDKWR
jgi:hypothetical protein